MLAPIIIHWFRQDLRLHDNPALFAAAQHGKVLPIYILDEVNPGQYVMGAASRCWLHHSLVSLNKSLQGKLHLYSGNPIDILLKLIQAHKVETVCWNRCYEPWSIERDKHIKQRLSDQGIHVQTFNGSLLWEPWEILKKDGTHYRVFTPFYRKGCLSALPPRHPLPVPALSLVKAQEEKVSVETLNPLPEKSWGQKMMSHWQAGEEGALKSLDKFLDSGILNYKEGRNFPAKDNVSRLSPHLHLGEISPNQAWYAVRSVGDDQNVDCFCSELVWREFPYHLLYHHPELPLKNLQSKFDKFQWHKDAAALSRWQKGQTGYPIIDAGMRELWQTGYMHNRVRMIVGSFLVKNLLLHWHHGERWFWDCLVDADLANNSASWQWIAGCGADAAPYFRIFNPVTQGQKFDPEGKYTRQYVPELESMPNKYLFNPWEVPKTIKTYSAPIVSLKDSRERALKAFRGL